MYLIPSQGAMPVPVEGRTARDREADAARAGRTLPGVSQKKKRLFPREKALAKNVGRCRYDRLISIAFCSMASAVVTALLLDWKPRWVMIMFTISVERSTLEPSIL